MSGVGHSRPGRTNGKSGHVRYAQKAEVNSWRPRGRDSSSETGASNHAQRTQRIGMVRLQAIVPNKPRGVRQANDRRVLNGIFWVQVQVRRGGHDRELWPYRLAVRWRQAGVWDQNI